MSGALDTMRERLADKEMLVEVAKDAWDQVYDGTGTEGAWENVAQAVADFIRYGTLRWKP